jgi:hypothetical protein
MMMEPTHDKLVDEEDEVPLVLFAIEPRSYAEAIGRAVAEMRPALEVLVVDPGDLPAEMEHREPALVFCGEDRPDGCAQAVRWARFAPYEEPEVVRVDGVPHRFPGLDLDDVLRLVDLHVTGIRRRSRHG